MQNKNNAIAITAIISGVVLIVALVALFAINPSSGNVDEDTVSVQGQAQIKAMPDLMVIYFNVETKGNTTEEARSANVEIIDKLVEGITALGFEKSEIVTENLNVREDCEWTQDGQECDGFVATHSVKIEMGVDDTEKMGNVVDAGVSAGAMVNYINFELTQESQNKYKAEAMKAAAKDAQIKADSVAEGFGKTAGKLVSVQVNDFGYYPWRAASGGAMMDTAMVKESVSNIQPGEEEISASVSATFKLR
ncbi:MAG: SIMPL domain-containing protein [Nanoarchaeota archaeon]|jgi:uncharacterized protein YggE|nr:SIMPL domain-containing protein [Nanoarchaeota archaeon]